MYRRPKIKLQIMKLRWSKEVKFKALKSPKNKGRKESRTTMAKNQRRERLKNRKIITKVIKTKYRKSKKMSSYSNKIKLI